VASAATKAEPTTAVRAGELQNANAARISPPCLPPWVPPFGKSLQQQPSARAVLHAEKRNFCFVFIKPHANVEPALKFIRGRLTQAGIKILCEGTLDAEMISAKGIIDRHYGSLAAKALDQRPQEHAVQPDAEARFQETFGAPWREALERGLVCNAREAMQRLKLTDEELDAKWAPLKIGSGKAKMGGGFYVGSIDGLYVVNAFYLAMRRSYIAPGKSVTFLKVEWSPQLLSWEEFRNDLVGDTHPETASKISLRGGVHRRWRELGLAAEPHVGDNVVHASASPFEAMLERLNWSGSRLRDDPFGQALLRLGISELTIDDWASDPIVEYRGERKSLFDVLENLDSFACLDVLREVGAAVIA